MAPDPLTEEAARWRARLESGAADPDAVEAWLQADPRHRSRFEAVGAVWSFFDEARDQSPFPVAKVLFAVTLENLGCGIACGSLDFGITVNERHT